MPAISIATDAIGKGLEFSRRNFKGFFMDMFRVNLFSMALFAVVAAVAVGVVAAALLAAGGGAIPQDYPALMGAAVPIVAILLVAYLLIYWLTESAQSVARNLTEGWIGKKKGGIISNFKKNAFPVLGYLLAMFGINLVFVWIPAVILSLVLLGGFTGEGYDLGSHMALNLGESGIRAYTSIAGIVIGVLFQFALWELVVARSGVVKSLSRSVEIVRKTLVPTIVFDILSGIISVVVAVIGLIAVLILIVVGAVAIAAVSAMGTMALVAGGIAIAAVAVVLIAAVSALTSTAVLPMQYLYWKKARAIK